MSDEEKYMITGCRTWISGVAIQGFYQIGPIVGWENATQLWDKLDAKGWLLEHDITEVMSPAEALALD